MTITITQTVQKVKLKRRKKVKWTEDTIDNEHMGRKSSKVCCIHHSKQQPHCLNKNKYERDF